MSGVELCLCPFGLVGSVACFEDGGDVGFLVSEIGIWYCAGVVHDLSRSNEHRLVGLREELTKRFPWMPVSFLTSVVIKFR